MLYHTACRYAHVFLYEFERRRHYTRSVKYPDLYCQVVKSVIKFANISLGFGYDTIGGLRSGSERETQILNTIIRESTDREITLREVTKYVLTKALLPHDTSPFNRPKKISKAVDAVIPEYL